MSVIEVKIPTLGESVSEGVIARWLKQEGATVQAQEPIIELETDKAVMEIPAGASGTLHIGVPAGATVGVGHVIATVDANAATASAAQPTPVTVQTAIAETERVVENKTPAMSLLSPSVRRLVAEHGVNPAQINGTGKRGRLTKGDVLEYVQSKAVASQPVSPQPAASAPTLVRSASTSDDVRREPMSLLRQRVAQRLVEAQQSAAILTTFNDVDMSAVLALRKRYGERFEARHGVKLGFMSLFGHAVIQALQELPRLNAQIEGTNIVYHHRVHLGVAVSTERGLMVPVVRGADMLPIAELEKAIGILAEKARAGKISPDELSGGTFSLTNGGVFGSLLSTPLLNPPQSGILGMHRIEERPVVRDGQVVARPMMYLALSYDHRLVDGKEAVTFLVRVKDFLEDPQRLLLEV